MYVVYGLMNSSENSVTYPEREISENESLWVGHVDVAIIGQRYLLPKIFGGIMAPQTSAHQLLRRGELPDRVRWNLDIETEVHFEVLSGEDGPRNEWANLEAAVVMIVIAEAVARWQFIADFDFEFHFFFVTNCLYLKRLEQFHGRFLSDLH